MRQGLLSTAICVISHRLVLLLNCCALLSPVEQVKKINGKLHWFGTRAELASFRISPPRLLCPSERDFVDYRGKLESVMEPSSVPTLWFSLSVFIFSWKPSDQGSVGCSPEGILPDKKNHEACSERCRNSSCHSWRQHFLFHILQTLTESK